jgi:cell division transport system permease protein
MRLVGASRWYTQLPFILEAALAGFVGALLAVGGLALTKVLFVDKTLAGPIKAGIITGVDWSQILTTGAIITAGGVAAAGLASYITLRLYVRL